MLTSPQRMLLEMDERLRKLQRRAQGDINDRSAYYASVVRSGNEEDVRNLAILGDEAAQAIFAPTQHSGVYSLPTQLEDDINNSQSRKLAVLIADELVDVYESMLDDMLSSDNFNVTPRALELVKNYYNRYRRLQQTDANEARFADLEYEMMGELNQHGRLYNIGYDQNARVLRSIVGGIGLACLVRTVPFNDGDDSMGRYRSGMASYLGNAIGRAQQEGISVSEIVDRLREQLQSQLF